ncbi:MAG: hypothetical protein J2O44_05420 [Porphyrobacter sp.]|nr:hypothetical protein [Porphyrobacter sp.]
MSAPARFRQADVRRAIAAAREAGITVARVEIGPDGRIVIVAGEAMTAANSNPLDRLLPHAA